MPEGEKKEPHRMDEMAVNLEDFVIAVMNANLFVFQPVKVEEIKCLETVPRRNDNLMSFLLELPDDRHKKGDMGRMPEIAPYFESLPEEYFSMLVFY